MRWLLSNWWIALLLAAPAVQAQGVFNMGTLTNTLSIPTETAKSAGSSKAATPAAKPSTNLRYAAVAAGPEQQVVQRFVSRNKTVNPQASKAISSTFAPGKESYRQLYREVLTNSGFVDNDVASAMALYMELGYRITHNIQDDKVVTPAQERALRTQVAQLLAGNPELRTPASSARVGEDLKLETLVLAIGWKQAQRGSQLSSFQAQVAQKFKQDYNLDFQHLKLTAQGFAPN